MKNLVILRHGKAELHRFGLEDFDRALAERGKRNATQMGEFISELWGTPDLILASSAKRTVETARLAAKGMNYPMEEIQTNRQLYLTSAYRILEILTVLDDEITSCVLVGHNPGLTELVNLLGVRLDNLPTGSSVCFSFKTRSWTDISSKNAEFEWIKLAREL